MPKKKTSVPMTEGMDTTSVITSDSDPRKEPLEVKEDQPVKKRLSFAVTDDGKIDWDAMRSETRGEIIAVLKDSPIPGVTGVEKQAAFSKETLALLWKGISRVETAAAAKVFRIPIPIAVQVFVYTPDEETQLAEATQKVLAKYEWANNIKYKEEFDLAGMTVMLFMVKVQIALHLKAAYEEKQKAERIPTMVHQPPEVGRTE